MLSNKYIKMNFILLIIDNELFFLCRLNGKNPISVRRPVNDAYGKFLHSVFDILRLIFLRFFFLFLAYSLIECIRHPITFTHDLTGTRRRQKKNTKSSSCVFRCEAENNVRD